MIKKNTPLKSYFDSLERVVEFFREEGIADKLKRIMPNLCIETKDLSKLEMDSLYAEVAEEYARIFDVNKDMYVYETSDRPVKEQIHRLVYDMSKKVGNRGEFQGIIVVELNKDFITLLQDYDVFFDFLTEQKQELGWKVVYSIREKSDLLCETLARNTFVEIIKINRNDLVKESATECLKKYYGMKLPDKFGKHIDIYASELRENEHYNEGMDDVLIQQLAYSSMLSAVERNVLKKANGVKSITENMDSELFMKKPLKSKIGFYME